MKMWKGIFVFSVLGLSINANALLIDNGTFTTDDSTELDWLDLTETAGMSYDDVSSQLGSGGLFYGWRYATQYEVSTLFDSVGGNGIYSVSGNSHQENNIITQLLELWGSTNGQSDSIFITDGFIAPGFINMGRANGIAYNFSPHLNNMLLTSIGPIPVSAGDLGIGSALVRDAVSVPEPSTFLLLGAGLIGIISAVKRKIKT